MRSDTIKDNSGTRSFWMSLGLHLAIVGLFSIKGSFFPSEAINIDGAIRVDMVALPEKHLPPIVKPKPKKKVQKKTVAKKIKVKKKSISKNKVNLKKRKNTMREAIERARALQKIEDMVEKEEEAAPIIKGNQIAKGSQLNGVKKLQYDNYIGELENHIRASWSIPGWLANLDLKASVLVKVTPQGFVKYKKILKSSGNETYDDAVLATIDRASPFPAPSDKFKKILESEGFVLGFPE